MSRRIWIAAAALIAGVGATALLLSQPRALEAPLTQPPTAVADVSARDVRVQHEYITITPARPDPILRPRPSTASLSASASNAVTVPSRWRRAQPTDRALLSKVGRAVAGDGRYRPEPFPRLR